jgi:hypothetical protein
MKQVGIGNEYSRLCGYMLSRDFIFFVGNDCNRAEDGLILREDYEETYGYIDGISGTDCTILEMLVKLAMRCEVDVMSNPDFGDRTNKWFWTFLNHLKLTKYKNEHFEKEEIDEILDDFVYRHYDKYGRGGLFEVKKPRGDMRTTEIWYQMMWWLDENFREDG